MINYSITTNDLLKELEQLKEENEFLKARYEQEIADREQSADALKKAIIDLEESNSEKDKFFSIIAHDLRSPIHGLLGLTEIMGIKGKEFSPEEIQLFSDVMRESIVNLYKLIESLLEWARLKTGSIDFIPKELCLSDVLIETIESIKQRASQKGITIHNEISKTQNVRADGKMVASVFRNLLSNAVKFTWEKGKVIVKAREREDGMIEISVTDNGIGICGDMVGKLFKLGENVGTDGTDSEASNGLGLLLCKEFVEKHGGSIWVESIENYGSSFYFTLPGLKYSSLSEGRVYVSSCMI